MEVSISWSNNLCIKHSLQSIFPDLRFQETSSASPPEVEQILRGLGWIFGLVCDSKVVIDILPSELIRSGIPFVLVLVVIIPSIRYNHRLERDEEERKWNNYQ